MDVIVWDGLGGLSNGSFFRANDSVNTSKPPGTSTPKNSPESLTETTQKILRGEAFCYSPNLAWFLMAAGTWCVVPYDLELSNDNTLAEILFHRLVVNHVVVLAYVGSWHWMLYFRGVCHRPFVPNRIYIVPKILHNIFYTVLGIIHWTFVEVAFIGLYQSRGLPYVDATTNLTTLAQTLLLSVALPSYRDVHFYFAHRLIHIRPLYKYVHSLHHRNTDTEPFSGLAMHPIEHMYYFTCYGPLLVLPLWGIALSPFLVFWMGFHLVISPAASHSGYEDHFSASLDHYLHHRYCECNYSAGINFDAFFGTLRTSLPEPSGQSIPPPPSDPKSSLGLCPEHPDYEAGLWALGVGAMYMHREKWVPPWVVAFVISMGPAVWAIILALESAPKSMSKRRACLAPFDKDSVASLALHLGLGVVLGVLPATHLLVLVLGDD